MRGPSRGPQSQACCGDISRAQLGGGGERRPAGDPQRLGTLPDTLECTDSPTAEGLPAQDASSVSGTEAACLSCGRPSTVCQLSTYLTYWFRTAML